MKALSVAILLLGALTVAQADDLRSQIEASSKTITVAMKKKDFPTLTKAMKASTTADFKYTEGGQSQNFDQMVENMKMGLQMMDKITVCKTRMLTLKRKGDTAVGTMEHTMTGTMKGEDKKTHTMSFTGVSKNTYVKQGGKWKMATMTWSSMKQTMDGKPMTGMGG